MAQGETKTLVFVCRRDFCRILERLLCSEGIGHARRARGGAEAFFALYSAGRAQELPDR